MTKKIKLPETPEVFYANEMDMKANVLSSEYISNHPYFTARRDRYQMPSGKIVDPYFVVELPPSIVVMGITTRQEVILVKQYRHPVAEVLLELPGGFIDKGETPEKAAVREMLEETGYRFSQFHALGVSFPNPGVLNNVCHFYLAIGGEKVAEQQLDPNEEIEIVYRALPEVRNMLMQSEFRQSLHALCLFYAFHFMDAQPAQTSVQQS